MEDAGSRETIITGRHGPSNGPLGPPIGQIPRKVARCLQHDEACYEMGVEIRK